MLPDIRAVVAAMAAAIGLLIIAFGVVATLRVAQESRAGSLHADLARRGQAAAAARQPVAVIETPGPTLLAKATEIEALPAADEPASPTTEPPAIESEEPAQSVAAVLESAPVAPVSAEPDPDNAPIAATLAAPESSPTVAAEPELDPPAAPAVLAAAPHLAEAPSPPASTAGIGGPSPEEIAAAKAQRKAAERARARKAAAEKRKKARAARLARERKLAAQRAAEAQKQQARVSSPPGGFGFTPTGSFNSAPFANTYNFGGATNRR